MNVTSIATRLFACGALSTCAADEAPARVPVASRSLASFSFCKVSRALEIEFRSGAIYRYRNVPEATYDGLLRAESKGRYFSTQIRGRHPFERVRKAAP
jgi:hypothetical protein